ncbi:MAG: hypothetical protein AAF483_02600 [Planctomycetota bacterium]
MSPIHFAIATIPVAVYFLLIGALRLRRRPLVTTGWRDTLTLGIAASGFVAIGPMQLFFPERAAESMQGWVWLALFSLYILALFLVLLSGKPRLIAYGMNEEQFRKGLLESAIEIDPSASWQHEVLSLPAVGIQLAMEPTGSTRVYQVAHVGLLHNLTGWLKLERSFVKKGTQATCPRSAAGWPFVISGALLLTFAVSPMIANPTNALAQLKEFLLR